VTVDPNPERPVSLTGRRSGFLRLTGGVSIIRYWLVNDFPIQSEPPSRVAAADEPMSRDPSSRNQ